MRYRTLAALFLGLSSLGLTAQGPHGAVADHIMALGRIGTRFERVAPLVAEHPDAQRDALWRDALNDAVLLAPDRAVLARLRTAPPAHLQLALPTRSGHLELLLEKVDPFTDDLTVVAASTGAAVPWEHGAHYRGMVQGRPGSLVALSFFKDEVMGFVSTGDEDLTIGPLEGDPESTHVLYRNADLRNPPQLVCGTPDDGAPYTREQLEMPAADRSAKCVRIYWEVNYDIFQGKGSVTNATNYVTGLFNQSATIYGNDGISVALSQVYVWDVASPYTATSTSTLLDQFGATRTSFNGDIAALLGYAGGGGIAWLSGLCTSNIAHRMGYCGISSSYQNVPTYSWSVEVVTHEQGHIMGSKHTHACAWNGNNTAIDGCGPAAGYTEGTCATGPLPTGVGGTIMSYCHLVSGVGINFNNGFGPQPLAVILNNINNASCLAACGGASCGAPTGLGATGVTTTSATLGWTAASGATSYVLQWKPASGSTWTTVSGITGTTYGLAGLTAGTTYQFQVSTVCSGGSSAYASPVSFTTASVSGCPDIQEPNNTLATAGTITSGTAYQALIATSTDVDYYKLVVSANSTISVSLTDLPFDYDVQLLSSGGTQLGSSTAGNTTAESITYAGAAPGNYYVRVYGYNGAFSATSCYRLSASATVVSTCTDNYEPNQTNGGARTIPVSGPITARISSASDVDWFKFANSAAQKYIRVTMSGLPANYDMRLYRGSGLLVTSSHAGTADERIVYNSTTVSSNYKVDVYPVAGAYDANACYTLRVELSATPFPPAGGLEQEPMAEAEEDLPAAYPNPVGDLLNITLPAVSEPVEVQVLDAMGRVSEGFTVPGTGERQLFGVDVRSLTPGIYFVRTQQADRVRVERVVVQR